MQVITPDTAVFNSDSETAKLGKSIVIHKYTKPIESKCEVSPPPGYNAVVVAGDTEYVLVEENLPEKFKGISHVWFVRKNAGSPWGIADIEYKGKPGAMRTLFGASGWFSYSIISSNDFLRRHFNGQQTVDSRDIKRLMKSHMNTEIKRLLLNRADNYGLGDLNGHGKDACQTELKDSVGKILTSFGLHLTDFIYDGARL